MFVDAVLYSVRRTIPVKALTIYVPDDHAAIFEAMAERDGRSVSGLGAFAIAAICRDAPADVKAIAAARNAPKSFTEQVMAEAELDGGCPAWAKE